MTVEGKTIFDFTEDEKILSQFRGRFGFKTNDEMKMYFKDIGDVGNSNMLMELSVMINDSSLKTAVLEFRKRYSDSQLKELNGNRSSYLITNL